MRLAEGSIALARERGIACVVGVANTNSTHGFVKRLGFELVGRLPATVLVPVPGRDVEVRSAWASDSELLRLIGI